MLSTTTRKSTVGFACMVAEIFLVDEVTAVIATSTWRSFEVNRSTTTIPWVVHSIKDDNL
jgi:hypothetical protein